MAKIKYNTEELRWELLNSDGSVVDYASGSDTDKPWNLVWGSISISAGGSVDVTATPGDILEGVTAVVRGSVITGDMPNNGEFVFTPNAEGISKGGGYYESIIIEGDSDLKSDNIKEGITIFGVTGTHQGGSDIDLSVVTATADKVLEGSKFISSNGSVVDGTIKTVKATLSDNVATVPKGYIATAQTLTVTEMSTPTVSSNVVTIGKGYNKAQKTVTVGTAKAATTITPGTADQTVAANTYLTGALTVKGDTNLTASNIKEGVTIFGVAGSLTAGEPGGSDSPYIQVSNSSVEGANGKYYRKIWVEDADFDPCEDQTTAKWVASNGFYIREHTGGACEIWYEFCDADGYQIYSVPDGSGITTRASNYNLGWYVNATGDYDDITLTLIEGSGNANDPDLSNLLPENIKYGVTINGVNGTYTDASAEADYYPVTSSDMRRDTVAWVNGQKVVGNMYELTADVLELEGTTSRMLGTGYYSDCRIEVWEDNLVSENIKDGITILGIEGTYKGTSFTPGTASAEYVLEGYTFTAPDGTAKYGTMPDRGESYVNIANGIPMLDDAGVSIDYQFPAGFYNGAMAGIRIDGLTSGNIRQGVSILGVDGTLSEGGTADDGISLYKCVDVPSTAAVNSVSSDSSDNITGYVILENLIWTRGTLVFTATEDTLNGKPIYYCAEYEEYLVLMKSTAGQYGWFMTWSESLQYVLSGSMSQNDFMADSGNWDTSGLCSDGPCDFHEVTMEFVNKVYTMYDGEIDSILITPHDGILDTYSGIYTLDPATATEYKYQRQFINADNGYVILFDNVGMWNPSMSKWVLGEQDSVIAEMVAVSKVTGPGDPNDEDGDPDGIEYGYDTIEGICELSWDQCYECIDEVNGAIAKMIPMASKPAASGGGSTSLTWSGRKVTKDASGNYILAKDVTHGLVVMGYTPEIGNVYNDNTTIMATPYGDILIDGTGMPDVIKITAIWYDSDTENQDALGEYRRIPDDEIISEKYKDVYVRKGLGYNGYNPYYILCRSLDTSVDPNHGFIFSCSVENPFTSAGLEDIQDLTSLGSFLASCRIPADSEFTFDSYKDAAWKHYTFWDDMTVEMEEA